LAVLILIIAARLLYELAATPADIYSLTVGMPG